MGLLTDEAIESYKREPIINYDNRYIVISSLRQVHKVIQQDTHDYTDNLLTVRPNYVVHGDWIQGQTEIRDKVISTLTEIGGELIEVPYTQGISTTEIIGKIKSK